MAMGGIFDQLSGKIIMVVGFVLIAVFLGRTLLMTKAANTPQELLYMSMQLQQVFSGAAGYVGLDNATAIDAGVVPENLIKGAVIQNAFGGDITIAPGAAGDTFTFTLTEIPNDECVTIANNKVNSWVSITVNGTAIAENDVTGVIAACTDDSTIIFEGQ